MRLQKIKLAGFKTFPDPVTLGFPSNCVAIVGPNGCGKSNIIDAVRWVLGESSARSLRGEAASDVIFNGSSTRKPIGQAVIELVFDNSAGRVRGPYGQYAEIAVRRQLNRDGDSVYSLNGTRCRRRDIHDLFLGTGLGPRSYAIIEQGLISKLIEARPEELRVYLEEAAGVAQYKERRRETELRLEQVQEHLQRLGDVSAELTRQLQVLEKQAKQAERFHRLQAEELRLRGELLALRWQAVAVQAEATAAVSREQNLALAAARAAQTQLERQLVELHGQLDAARVIQDEAQQALFLQTSASQVMQQRVQQTQEQTQRLRVELARLTQSQLQLEAEQRQDQQRLAQIAAELSALEVRCTAQQTQHRATTQQMQQAEQHAQDLQQRWDAQQQALQQSQHAVQLEQSRAQQQARLCRQLDERRQRLQHEAQTLAAAHAGAGLETLQTRWLSAQTALAQLHLSQTQAHMQQQAARATLETLTGQLTQLREQRQHLQAERAALRTLDAQADAGQAAGQAWRARQPQGAAAVLAAHLQAPAAWESALESLLGSRLRAVCVPNLAAVALAGGLPQGEIWLLEPSEAVSLPAPDSLQALCVADPYSAALELSQIQPVPDLATALAQRETLAPGMSLLTLQGEWVGRHWLMVRRGSPEAGLLARRRQGAALEVTLAELAVTWAQLEPAQAAAHTALHEAERHLEAQRRAEQQAQRDEALLRAEFAAAQSKHQVQSQRTGQLVQDLAELDSHWTAEQTTLVQAQTAQQAAVQAAAVQRQAGAELQTARDAAQTLLRPLRQQTHQQQAELAQLQTRQVQLHSERDTLAAGQSRSQRQLTQLAEQRLRLDAETEISTHRLGEMQTALQAQLSAEQTAESALQSARIALQTLEATQRDQTTAQHTRRLQAEGLAGAVEQLSRSEFEQTTQMQQLEAQIAELPADRAALLAALSAQADAATWQTKLAETQIKRDRLGAVNLAAMEEYTAQTERKQYLDAQVQDLEAALATLRAAIVRIDQDTRARLRSTVETVDNNFQVLFPRLFGGGQASLVLTGDDLLAAGVTVMARPPGKRNSTIHLLSGGEKTLTALALVFALFELNPAPFCLLDEVDAPLDETNVGRFGELLQFMAERVQFIFITHNKATMAMAAQLIGITMQEPGVSRAVAVDIDAALALTEQ